MSMALNSTSAGRGKPADNAKVESFNGCFRQECPNARSYHWTTPGAGSASGASTIIFTDEQMIGFLKLGSHGHLRAKV
jgi:hypothetical protein